jgi:hypothetical protein
MRACRSRGWPVCSKQALEIHVSVVRCRRSIHVLWRWGQRALPTIRRLRRSERATESMRNAPPMSRAIEARARTQPVRQIWVGQKLAANGNQIRIAFPEPCFRGKPSAAMVRLMLSPSWRRHPRLQPLFGIRQHDGWTAMGQTEKNSVRANVFRFAPELGHCWMQSACLKRARPGSARPQESRPYGRLIDAMRARFDPFPRTKWSDPLTYTDAQKRSDLMAPSRARYIAAIESMLALCWPYGERCGRLGSPTAATSRDCP